MSNISTKKYDDLASYFSQLPEYSMECGTDFIALKEVPNYIKKIQSLNNILDLGCGTGLATRFLKKHAPHAQVIGADINKTMLLQAKIADPKGVYLHITKDLATFLPDTFDMVVCSFVLHENNSLEELKTFFAAIHRVLRKGGLVVMWDPHENLYQGEWTTVEVLDKGIKKDGDSYKVKLYPAGAVVSGTHWSSQTVLEVAANNGFVDGQIQLPTANPEDNYPWKDEVKLAPYYIFSAYKK